MVGLSKVDGPDPQYEDICYAGASDDTSRLAEVFPSMSVTFKDNSAPPLAPTPRTPYLPGHGRSLPIMQGLQLSETPPPRRPVCVVVLQLEPVQYLFKHTRVAGAYCLGVFDYGYGGTLLGGVTTRSTSRKLLVGPRAPDTRSTSRKLLVGPRAPD